MENTQSRTYNSVFNIITNSFGMVVSLLVSFLNRIVFLRVLDATYLGVSGLFSNILLIFSLAELGVGSALTQMFYKPFAEKNYEQLSKVTHTTRILLNLVGIVILLLTIVFTPFLQLFVNDINAVPNMRLIFFLYGISSSVTYFLGYYRTIITANQQAYKLVRIDNLWKILALIVQSAVLIITRNFILFLATQIILNFSQNIIIKDFVKKQIPQIDYKTKEFISKDEANVLLKNVAGLSLNRISYIVTNGTDNIIISKFLNLVTVGLASNYVLITQSVSSMVEAIFGPLLSSIGNFCVSEDDERKYKYFQYFNFAAFWMYGFCSIACLCIIDIFISVFFGSEYCIPKMATFFLCFDCFCSGMYRIPLLFRTAQGLFWEGKFRPLLQAIVNLVVSLILVSYTHQLWAVYAGTVASRILITVWYEPLIVLKHGMNKKPWKYYARLISYFAVYFIALFFTYFLVSMLPFNVFINLILGAFICLIIPNVIIVLAYFKTDEFKYWLDFVKQFKRKLRPGGRTRD